MLKESLYDCIDTYEGFPKQGIAFKDITPIFRDPDLFNKTINYMSNLEICRDIDSLIAIDARGFLIGSSLALRLNKPLVLARKPGKLPGQISSKTYELEYGTNSLSIQNKCIELYQNFLIIDDLLATGGTVNCVSEIISEKKKNIKGLIVIIELLELNGRKNFNFPVESLITY